MNRTSDNSSCDHEDRMAENIGELKRKLDPSWTLKEMAGSKKRHCPADQRDVKNRRQKVERRRVFRISVSKLKAIDDPECFLRRSVLIANTLRHVQRDLLREREEELSGKQSREPSRVDNSADQCAEERAVTDPTSRCSHPSNEDKSKPCDDDTAQHDRSSPSPTSMSACAYATTTGSSPPSSNPSVDQRLAEPASPKECSKLSSCCYGNLRGLEQYSTHLQSAMALSQSLLHSAYWSDSSSSCAFSKYHSCYQFLSDVNRNVQSSFYKAM